MNNKCTKLQQQTFEIVVQGKKVWQNKGMWKTMHTVSAKTSDKVRTSEFVINETKKNCVTLYWY